MHLLIPSCLVRKSTSHAFLFLQSLHNQLSLHTIFEDKDFLILAQQQTLEIKIIIGKNFEQLYNGFSP
jgi:hypothetical protein